MLSPTRHSSRLAVSALFAGALFSTSAWANPWRTAYDHWTVEESLEPGDLQGDADADGLTNFQEFALGTAPGQKTSLDRVQKLALINRGGRVRVEFSYQRGIPARDGGVEYLIERSEDLRSWREATPLILLTEKTEISSDGERERVTMRLDEEVPAETPLFFRLSIEGSGTAALAAEWPTVVTLADLDGVNGITLLGAKEDDIMGASVSNLGDVNADGFDDVIVGARGAGDDFNGNFSGQAFVVFGGAALPARLGVEALDGTNGFSILGGRRDDRLGSVSAAGDINGDGVPDILVSAHLADNPEKNVGAAYVIFGNPAGFPATVEVNGLDGVNGFTMLGAEEWDRTGVSVSSAGDLNGDGMADIAVGADLADPEDERSGKVYVVYGDDRGFPAVMDLGELDGTRGFTLEGPGLDKFAGRDVANAGDVNGDGVSDLLIGTGDRRQRSDFVLRQEVFVLFGNNVGFPARLKLENLRGELGFKVRFTSRANEYAGAALAGNGDFNGDGLSDIVIANEEGGVRPHAAGAIYVIYGRADGFPDAVDAELLDGSDGAVFRGIVNDDNAGSAVDFVGDANGDGVDDLLIGAFRANGLSDDDDFTDSGEAYLIFGGADFPAENAIAGLINTTAAVFLPGVDDDDLTGRSVSRAGDVNGDGRPDFLVGAHAANRDTDGDGSDEETNNGAAYVIFGR